MASITHATVATGTDAGNGEIRKAEWNEDHVLVGVPYVFAHSAVAVSVSAVTTEEVLATITIPAGAMGANGYVDIYTSFSANNNANQKQMRIRVGGTGGNNYLNSNLASLVNNSRFTRVMNINSVSSQKALTQDGNANGFGSAGGAAATSTVTTSSAWDLVISGQKVASAADTLTLDSYTVLICYGA